MKRCPREPKPPLTILASYYARAGDKKTRSLLEESYQGNDLELVTIKAPQFDPVKAEPWYRHLVRRIGLPPI